MYKSKGNCIAINSCLPAVPCALNKERNIKPCCYQITTVCSVTSAVENGLQVGFVLYVLIGVSHEDRFYCTWVVYYLLVGKSTDVFRLFPDRYFTGPSISPPLYIMPGARTGYVCVRFTVLRAVTARTARSLMLPLTPYTIT